MLIRNSLTQPDLKEFFSLGSACSGADEQMV
jgi:hypothetical protein